MNTQPIKLPIPSLYSGKVRDLYEIDPERILLVVSG